MNNSPNKIAPPLDRSLGAFYLDVSDNFTHKYVADYSHPRSSHTGELLKQQIESEIEALNSTLCNVLPDRQRLGDFFSEDLREVEKTLEVIRSLLAQRQKDMETKNEIYSNSRKAEGEKAQLSQQLQKLARQLKRSQNERDNLSLKLKASQKSFKESQQRLAQQKEEYLRKYKSIETRQNQYKNENRKQEATIKSLQQRLARGQEKGPFRNSFEVIQQLQSYGPTIVLLNAEHEYNQVVARTMEENYLEITKENQYLKDCLQGVQKQLTSVLQLKKEVLRRRRGYDTELDSAFQLKPLRPELLNLPARFSKEGTGQLAENVSRFKEAMRAGQAVDERENEQRAGCVGGVKNLIKNYKNIVESQEQLLGKVILKAKEFKSAELQALDQRYSRPQQQDEIQRAKRFLEDQSAYLDSKNKQLEATRRAMQTTIRKVQQQRQQFSRRSQQANEQVQRARKQIQLLPAMLQQQLRKA